jgi:hypothetical protein
LVSLSLAQKLIPLCTSFPCVPTEYIPARSDKQAASSRILQQQQETADLGVEQWCSEGEARLLI